MLIINKDIKYKFNKIKLLAIKNQKIFNLAQKENDIKDLLQNKQEN